MFARIGYPSASLAAILLLSGCPGDPKIENGPEPEPPDLSLRLEQGETRAGVVVKEEDLIGGLKAEGRIGDIKLYNSHVSFIVEGIRPASGFRLFGGNLIDADIVRPEGEPHDDRFGEVFFAWDLRAFDPEEIEIVSDGRDGIAHVRITGKDVTHAFAEDVAGVFIDAPAHELEFVYDYRLGPNDRELHLQVSVGNPSDEWIEIRFPLILTNHGDGAHQFEPGPGFEGGAYGRLPYIAAVGRDLSYALMAADDDIMALIQYEDVTLLVTDEFDLYPGESWIGDYYFVVTDQSVAGIDAARRRLIEDVSTGSLSGKVELPATAEAKDAWIAVMSEASVVTLAPVGEDGGFVLEIEPGDYEVHAYAHRHAPAPPVPVSVSAGQEARASLEIEAGARVTSFVEDPTGNSVRARVTFFRQGATPSPFAPVKARHGPAWRSTVSGVAYVIDESETIVLPAGTYRAVASRGPSWEIDETVFEVSAGEETGFYFVIEESVNTEGWVSSDMHMHGYLSPDSHVLYETRVQQAVTDALDIPLMTEHVWAAGLQEKAEEMGLGDEVIGIAGQEVTTFVFGHFNVFPVKLDPSLPNQGGVPEHGNAPTKLFELMRQQHEGETLIQINHPRGARPGSYFSWVGLDPDADTVDLTDGWVLDWDLIEVFNGSCGGSRSLEVLADWIGMTNNGHRKGISGTTDSHRETRIPGIPRNWIQVDRDELAADHSKLVAPMRERRSFVSCGPFVRFEAADGTGLGGMTTVDAEGKAELMVKVEAPTWMQINEVRLLENGVPIEILDVRPMNGEVVRFDETLTVEPEADAWYAIEVRGSGSLAPVSWVGAPYAITNPIEIDADGDGVWTAPAHRR